jgi:transcriptional regulator PpsR
VKGFAAPGQSLGRLSSDATASLIAAASDIVLVVDRSGVVRDLALQSEQLALRLEDYESWLGRRWIDTVTEDSRPKIEALLSEAKTAPAPRWRQLNHPSAAAGSVALLYTAVQIAKDGRMVVFGRDVQPLAALQQRLVEAQQSMERDYLRLRHMEARYRLLFELASVALLILDTSTHKIVEANPAAREIVGDVGKRNLGRPFPDLFDAESAPAVRNLLAGVQMGGRTYRLAAQLAHSGRPVVMSASLFRQATSSLFLVQLAPADSDDPAAALSSGRANWLKIVESLPDAFVLAGPHGRILTANAAFLDLAQLATETQAHNEPLDRWIGRPGADLDVLLNSLRQHGSVRLFATSLRGEYGAETEVEISAVSVVSGGPPTIGLVIRDIGRRLTAAPRTRRELPRSVEQLTELIGRVSLKDLVRETTDVIERLCIEAALEITSDNRASAAEMLGLSRQGLYMKLRRYGLGELDAEGDDAIER